MNHLHSLLRHRIGSMRGSALLATIIVCTVLALSASGFLVYLNHEYYLNYRSLHWTQALHLAEAGLEEGFFEMNERYAKGSAFLAGNGWQTIGGSVSALLPLGAGETGYSKTVSNFTDANGNVVGSYTVQVINPSGANPYVVAKGTVANAPYGIHVSRLTKIVLQNNSVFNFALFAKQSITGSGNMSTDSYISSDPAYSTNGQYDYAKRRGNGDIGSNGTASNTIQLSGNADINGRVAVGPGGSLTTSGNASVGPIGYGSGVAPGYFRNDMAADVPDAALPNDYSTATWTSKGNITSTTTLTSGNYYATTVNLSANTKLTFSGTVRLHVLGNFATSGNSIITLLPGASVQIYCSNSIAISGNGDINNSSTPDKLQIYGLPTCTAVNLSGNGNINATLYAPQAAVSINGNGDISGAIVAKSISMSGNGVFHYDEALKTTVGGSGYTVKSWQEINISQN